MTREHEGVESHNITLLNHKVIFIIIHWVKTMLAYQVFIYCKFRSDITTTKEYGLKEERKLSDLNRNIINNDVQLILYPLCSFLDSSQLLFQKNALPASLPTGSPKPLPRSHVP